MTTQVSICESCGCGSPTAAAACVHCGGPTWLSYLSQRPVRMFDTECYRNYWLCKFDNPSESFQMFPGHPLDTQGLRRALSTCTAVGFNSGSYDLPIIECALTGADNATLKDLSDRIIVGGERIWHRLDWIDHIDMIEVLPGQAGLKAYGGKMHAPKIQDLPIEPGASIGIFDRVNLREYCDNDLETTRLAYDAMAAQRQLRDEMSAEYRTDLRSKSDAQIAEAAMKQILGYKPAVPTIPAGTPFVYRAPKWMHFLTPDLQDLFRCMTTLPFSVNPSGGASAHIDNHYVDWGKKQVRWSADAGFVGKPVGWREKPVLIGRATYTVGTGGLHSNEQRQVLRRGDTVVVRDSDVASYYPSLILTTGIYPSQIGPVFQEIYRDWFDRRMAAKNAGIKKTANSLKTLLNGTFGKLGSIYSIFYAPSELIQVTVTGQLALLMLIERMELSGVRVMSANTDGIICCYRPEQEPIYLSIIRWWETMTGFSMEFTDYRLVVARDVNSYIAITTDGKVKLKGVFAPPEPGPSGWPNPTTQACVDAVVAYLKDGTPIATTVLACRDVRQFVAVRTVKGGGVWRGEYIGKVVRWYYATDGDVITYRSNGNHVPDTEGAFPMMQLSDTVPENIDYGWYVRHAEKLLDSAGITL